MADTTTPAADLPKKKAPMGSFIQYQCPVSARITKVALSDVPVGLFVEVEDLEEEAYPPVGCGRIIIEVTQINPALAEVQAEIEEIKVQQAAALQEYLREVQGRIMVGIGDLDELEITTEQRAELGTIRAGLTDADLAPLPKLRADLLSGALARKARKRIKRDFPFPMLPDNETVVYRCILNGIKQEYLLSGIKALQGVGYPIREIGEEEAEP